MTVAVNTELAELELAGIEPYALSGEWDDFRAALAARRDFLARFVRIEPSEKRADGAAATPSEISCSCDGGGAAPHGPARDGARSRVGPSPSAGRARRRRSRSFHWRGCGSSRPAARCGCRWPCAP